MEYLFNLFSGYFQISLEDDGPSYGEAIADMLVAVPHAIAIGTARNTTVPVTIELRDGPPPADDFAGWDHVTECSIVISSGHLAATGNDYWPDAARIALPPGTYAVRILYGGLDTISEDGLEGDDHYRVQLWPGAERPPAVLKRHTNTRGG